MSYKIKIIFIEYTPAIRQCPKSMVKPKFDRLISFMSKIADPVDSTAKNLVIQKDNIRNKQRSVCKKHQCRMTLICMSIVTLYFRQ